MKHRDPWSTFENGTSITIIDKRKQGLLNLTIVLSSPKLKATVKKLSA